jgi:hypothetical protein
MFPNVERVPHFLTLLGILIMKKSKLLVASVFVSFALVSVSSFASPGKKKKIEPVVEVSIQTTHSSTNWFFDLFDF